MSREGGIDQLTSPDRFVVPLPSISEPDLGSGSQQTGASSAAAGGADDERGGPMIIDYLSRLARFEPRVRRISLSRRRHLPDAAPFVRSASGIASPAGDDHSSPPSPDTHRRPSRPTTDGKSTPSNSSRRGGYTLLDFERMLLSPLSRLVGHSTTTTNDAASSTDTGEGQGLDIDLSDALDDMRIDEPSPEPSSSARQDGLPRNKGTGLLLDLWTHEQLIEVLRSTGVLSALARKGFKDVSLIFDTSDPVQHRLSCVDSSLFSPDLELGSADRFLVDVYLKRRETFNPKEMVCYQLMQRLLKYGSWEALREATGEIRAPFVGLEGAREVKAFFDKEFPASARYAKVRQSRDEGWWNVTELAWMQMHDPRPAQERASGGTDDERPLLPSQRFRGLGLGRLIGTVMEQMASESPRTDALLNFPFHYHLAIMYATRGYRHLDPIYEAYVSWIVDQLKPFNDEHGFAFVAWAVVSGHMRRVVEARTDTGEWVELSTRMERWSSSEQVFPTSEAVTRFVESTAHRAMFAKYKAIFDKDGGANMEGVHVGALANDKREKRARLIINLEGCPELWKYSKVWHNRDPETGEFR